MPYPIDACSSRLCRYLPSSETQGQIVGARESLNGRKNKARRKVKNSEKSSSLLAVLYFSFVPYFSACLDFPRPHYLPVGLRGWISACQRTLGTIWSLSFKRSSPFTCGCVGRCVGCLRCYGPWPSFWGICDLGGCTSKTYTTDFVTCNPTF